MGCHLSKSSSTKVTAGNNHDMSKKKAEQEAEATRLILELQPFNYSSTAPELKGLLLSDRSLRLLLSAGYLNNAVSTKKLLASFKLGISRARGIQEIILQALKSSQNADEKSRALTLHKLREFKEAGDPFDGLFADVFSSLSERLQSTVKHLNSRRNEIKRKLALTKIWKKVWKVLLNVVFISGLVCAVTLAVVSAPPLATAAVTAGSTAIKTAEPCLDLIWADDRLDALKREKDVVLMVMNRNTTFGIHELESIRAMLKRLEMKIGSISSSAGFALANQEVKVALKMAMDAIEPKVREIGKWIDEVEMKVSACEDETGKAVAEFLNAIVNDF